MASCGWQTEEETLESETQDLASSPALSTLLQQRDQDINIVSILQRQANPGDIRSRLKIYRISS
jgi:hypothetical protein